MGVCLQLLTDSSIQLPIRRHSEYKTHLWVFGCPCFSSPCWIINASKVKLITFFKKRDLQCTNDFVPTGDFLMSRLDFAHCGQLTAQRDAVRRRKRPRCSWLRVVPDLEGARKEARRLPMPQTLPHPSCEDKKVVSRETKNNTNTCSPRWLHARRLVGIQRIFSPCLQRLSKGLLALAIKQCVLCLGKQHY